MPMPLIARPISTKLLPPTPYPAPGTMLVVPYNAHKGWPRNGSNVLVVKDGSDGDERIMAAYDALPTFTNSTHKGAGRIVVGEGQINARMDKIIFDKSGVVLEGQGWHNTAINPSNNGTAFIQFTNSGGNNSSGALRHFSTWGTGYTGSCIYLKPTSAGDDMGYDGYTLEGIHAGEFSVSGLIVGNGTGAFNTLSVRDCSFQGNVIGIHVNVGGGTSVMLFERTTALAGGTGIAAQFEMVGSYIEDAVWSGGQIGGGGSGAWGLKLIACTNLLFMGIHMEGLLRDINIDAGSYNNRFLNIRLSGTTTAGTGSDVYVAGDYNVFDQCSYAPGATGTNASIYEIVAGADNTKIFNQRYVAGSPTFYTDAGTNTRVILCPGYVTRNGGAQANVADGGTIAHGLAVTPTHARVTPSVAGEMASITAIDGTNLTVAIKTHAGAAGTTQTIYWEAEALQ